jgi:hypothetical protein
MSSSINSDQDLLKNGRKKPLKDVAAPLREQAVEKLVRKLEEKEIAQRISEMWHQGNTQRQDWLSRNEKLMEEFDQFLTPIYEGSTGWTSTLHLPVAFTVAKTYHARMFAALMGIDPPFTVKARQSAYEDRTQLVQDLMRYTLSQWMNGGKGVEEVVDAWLWSWVTSGVGLLKQRWDRKFTRYIDVVTVQEQNELGQVFEKEVEQEVQIKTYDGPCVDFVFPEDLLIIGGGGDPDEADAVLHQSYYTASQLWSMVDQKVFRKEAVEEIINSGEQYLSAESVNSVKEERANNSGLSSADSEVDLQRYQVIEAHVRVDVDGSGINSDIVVWIHKDTRQILRATYLYRLMKSGLRPFVKTDFHRRHGQTYGVGLIELLYSLTKELDAMHNMKIDFGIISTMPMGFYRATSSLTEERLPYEPGSLIPLDNPQTDVFFPNLGNRSVFSAQEEQSLMAYIERVTSIGTRALLGESNANLDVFLRRMNRGWRRFLHYTWHQLQEKIPEGFEFRVFGDDGKSYFQKVQSREELQGMYDFELEANSANSNQSIRQEVANQIYQITGNPLDIQLGIITPLERFEALKNLLVVSGVKDFARYLKKPQGLMRIFTPEEIVSRTLSGVDIPLTPEQDLQGFLSYFKHIMSGKFQTPDGMTVDNLALYNEQEVRALAQKAAEAKAMLEALQAQQAQAANAAQMRMNQTLSMNPTPLPPGGGPQANQGMPTGTEG